MKTGLLSKMPHPGATKPTTPHFVMGCTSNGKKTLNTIISEESRDVLCYGSPSIPSLPDLLQTSNSYTSTLPICHTQYLELNSQWTNVVGYIFKTNRRNQDLDKKKIEHEKQQGTPMISSTPSIINFPVGEWRNHREIRWGEFPPPLHFTFIAENMSMS